MKKIERSRKAYSTDLTDEQWAEIEPEFKGMHRQKWEKRELLNEVLYIVKTGCQWRNLPNDFPPYPTVWSFFRRAKQSGLWDKILQHMVKRTREAAGKEAGPTYALVDSQSVKTVAASEGRGYDGGKNERQEAPYCSRHDGKFAGSGCSSCQYS